MSAKPTYEELEQSVKDLQKEVIKRKQAEKALEESEKRFRLLYERAPLGYQSLDEYGHFLEVNQAWLDTLGYSREEVIGKSFGDFLHPDWVDHFKQNFPRFKAIGEILGVEFEMVRKDGSLIMVDFNGKIGRDEKGNFRQTHCILHDITAQKETQETLRESEEKYRTLITNIPDVTWTTDSEGKTSFISPNIVREFGYTQEEIYKGGDSIWLGRIHPEDVGKVEKAFRKLLERGTKFDVEYRIKRKDGEWIQLHDRSVGVYERDGVKYADGIFSNITNRKQAEEALLESEEKYRNILESIGEGYYEVDLDGNFTFFNDAMCRIRGYSRDELMGMNNRGYMDPVTAKKVFEAYNQVYTTGKAMKGYEWEALRKDGTKGYVEVSASLMKNSENRPIGFRGIVRDVTERKFAEDGRKQLETQLQRAQKMEAMGLMAGGVAHDLNNILSGIVSYPELLLLDLPEDSPLRNPIKTIQESGMRAADVVEDLLTIARGVTTSKEVLNLNSMIEEYMDSADQQKLEKIKPLSTYRTELDPELLNITCSASHVKKILMNLAVNASEAIEGTGTVTISTMNRYLDEPLKGYEDVRTGEHVLLSISDDGSGISPQDLDKIFEPFYTKKVMGRSGTGLGLAVVWNSMQDHKGYINVRSNEKGTVFELYFPTTREKVVDEGEQVPLDDYLGHGEKILVVDDEERQRVIACGILTRLGYKAEAVSSGEEAIEYVKEKPVDLILLDMVMPKGINGRKTYEEIIKIRPGQKAIIASGYAKTKEVDKAQELGAGKYIKKPYTLPKVGLAVKEELEK